MHWQPPPPEDVQCLQQALALLESQRALLNPAAREILRALPLWLRRHGLALTHRRLQMLANCDSPSGMAAAQVLVWYGKVHQSANHEKELAGLALAAATQSAARVADALATAEKLLGEDGVVA